MRTWHGYDYRLGREVEQSQAEWRRLIRAIIEHGGRMVRHTRKRPGDDDLLLFERGRIVVEIYDREAAT